jgi:hypothetical protein
VLARAVQLVLLLLHQLRTFAIILREISHSSACLRIEFVQLGFDGPQDFLQRLDELVFGLRRHPVGPYRHLPRSRL